MKRTVFFGVVFGVLVLTLIFLVVAIYGQQPADYQADFRPTWGTTFTGCCRNGNRYIEHHFMWSEERLQVLQSYGNVTYEHDFWLNNYPESSLPGVWAQDVIPKSLEHNFPQSAHVYEDTRFLDDEEELAFTIGIADARQLQANVEYWTIIQVTGGHGGPDNAKLVADRGHRFVPCYGADCIDHDEYQEIIPVLSRTGTWEIPVPGLVEWTTECPQPGGVILYKHKNYICGWEVEGMGYVRRESVGWQNVGSGFNDKASSIKIPSGWSVKLYQHDNRGGASVCRNGSDGDFAGDYFDGGVYLNDQISSFEVFDNANCGSSTPPTPTVPVTPPPLTPTPTPTSTSVPPVICPSSGGAILYIHPNYDCNNQGAGSGYVMRTTTGWQNVPGDFQDQASSLFLPSGWSMRVWNGYDRGGNTTCFNASDNYLPDNNYDGTGTDVDDSIRSFEVFSYQGCSGPPPSSCPASDSGGVILYQNPSYDCGGKGANDGYFVRTTAGGQDLPGSFKDKASSIAVPSGWSVRVYKDDNLQGSSACINASDGYLPDNSYGEGGTLDDSISSIEVFNTSSCQGTDTTPPTGSITSPADGATISSCPLIIQASASDSGSGVDKVEFHAYFWQVGEWHHLGDDATAPYSFSWDCSALPDQDVILTIHILDKAGNEVMDPGGYINVRLRRNCPQSGGVLLYEHADHDCGGDPEGTGFVRCTTTGWQNISTAFNNRASSVRIPVGLSVRLYEQENRGGASICFKTDQVDFGGGRTFESSLVLLNDQVSSFEVFDNSTCSGSGGASIVFLPLVMRRVCYPQVRIDVIWLDGKQFHPGQVSDLHVAATNLGQSPVDSLWSFSIIHPDGITENLFTDFPFQMRSYTIGQNNGSYRGYVMPQKLGVYTFRGAIKWGGGCEVVKSTTFEVVE